MTVYGKKQHQLGFWQVDPMPTPEELEKYYREVYFQQCGGGYAEKYSQDVIDSYRNRAVVAERIFHGINGDVNGAVYDVGCGEAFFIDYFLGRGWTVEACDFSSCGLERQNPHLKPYFTQGDIFEILREKVSSGRKFDLMNLHGVLEHVRDPFRLLDLLKALMHERSLLRIDVPNDYSRFQQFLMDNGCIETETWFSPPDHLSYFNFGSLRAILADRGLRVHKMLAEFPIEMFLVNEHSNYWKDRDKGKQAHLSRLKIDNFLVAQDLDKYIAYMEAAAGCEFGRAAIAFVTL